MHGNEAWYDWTEARVEQLKTLWADPSLSCADIANAMDGTLSRNAVIGKAKRIGLGNRHINPHTPRRVRKKRQLQRSGRGFISLADADQQDNDLTPDIDSVDQFEARPIPETFRSISLINLMPWQCRYPRTIDGHTLFCGQAKQEDSSYCIECHRRCTSRHSARVVDDATKERRLAALRARRAA